MNDQTTQSLSEVKAHLKSGGTYADTLIESITQCVFDELMMSAIPATPEQAKEVGQKAAMSFLNQWVSSPDPSGDPIIVARNRTTEEDLAAKETLSAFEEDDLANPTAQFKNKESEEIIVHTLELKSDSDQTKQKKGK
jgi:hypothetical protein